MEQTTESVNDAKEIKWSASDRAGVFFLAGALLGILGTSILVDSRLGTSILLDGRLGTSILLDGRDEQFRTVLREHELADQRLYDLQNEQLRSLEEYRDLWRNCEQQRSQR
ncbi:MAG TPA: hypothetical protein VJV78_02070 [Polyangiales bacterium]|nr:hypothetical protein [Polyangiales bacterium]